VNPVDTLQPALGLRGVTKRFGDFVALSDIAFDLMPGQVHALLGANGSGKSTLVKIMSGVLQPDEGALEFGGVRLAGMGSPAAAAHRGVRVVHQEAPLIDSTTVAETVAFFRGFGTSGLGRISWRSLRRRVQDLLDRMDVPVDAGSPCASLGPADRAGLALAIVVGDLFEDDHPAQGGPVKLLIVDEVTAAIPQAETARHLERLRTVADRGVAVLMVTHRLAELQIADDLTVLRGGRLAYREQGGPRRTTEELVAEMIGPTTAVTDAVDDGGARTRTEPVRRLWSVAPPLEKSRRPVESAHATSGPIVELVAVSGQQLDQCSFTARPGEIVGFAGLRQSGIEELPHILAGGAARTSGDLVVNEHRIRRDPTPAIMLAAGLTAIPSDRLRAGGVASLSVSENVVLPALRSYWHQPARRRAVVRGVIDSFDVRPPDPHRLFGALSGGNQQKVLLGKWLALRPAVLVLDDPTYGVDPAAREIIFDAIADAASQGVCVLFFSTEPEQLARVCHRVVILREGANAAELTGPQITLENLISWSYE